jgi:ABC-type phosphate transport system substrate-binding protein
MSTRLALAVAVLLAPAAASAQIACNAISGTNDPGNATATPMAPPVYITGSTALEPLLKKLGPIIATQATNPRTLVYLKDGSCSGVQRLVNQSGNITVNMLYLPPSGFCDTTATPAKAPCTCTVAAASPIVQDLVLSDVDPTLCPNTTPPFSSLPAGWKDFQGPVNDMVFVVPMTSNYKSLSAEMAYLLLGKGAGGQIMPWMDPTYFYIRTNDSGTRAMITANIGTTTNAWQGCMYKGCPNPVPTPPPGANGSGDVYNDVAAQNNSPNADKTIGILGEDYYDQGNNRTTVKALAFRAFGQEKAYWPDSSVSARDRKNVRDGHYKIWGYVHMIGPTTPGNGQFFIDLMQGNPPAGFTFPAGSADIDDVITDTHLTPRCAMNVTHDIEGKDQKALGSSAPPPCGCSFEARATGATPAGCTACSGAMPCASGVCRKGFCEAK